MREHTIPQKPAPEVRRPLQESSKQNIISIPSESTTPSKGVKTIMPTEQLSANDFKFTEENVPPDEMEDSMKLMEEGKEIDNNNMDVIMQEDVAMNVGVSTHPSKG